MADPGKSPLAFRAERAGLTSREAADRLRRNGANVLPSPPRNPMLAALAAELVHFFALMLWIAGALAIVAGLVPLGFAIFGVVIVNALFSFAQERRSDRAAERLNALLPRNVLVRRDGVTAQISADDIVVGDLLVLSAGDRISSRRPALLRNG